MRCYILLLTVSQSAVYSSLLALQPYYEFVQGAKIANPFYVLPLIGMHSIQITF